MKTTNGGTSWTEQASDTRSELLAVSAADSNNAWAVGHQSWIDFTQGGAWIYWYFGDQGVNGIILHTSNGGARVNVLSVTPNAGTQDTSVNITDLSGSYFANGATVRIEQGTKVINATNVAVSPPSKITCTLNLAGAPTGAYKVIVKNPDSTEGILDNGFTVNAPASGCGAGAGAMLPAFGLMLGLMSLFRSGNLKRLLKRKKT